eukprot:SAG31_NODE_753_length_12340_cov_8.786619_5_plen_1730_part_00
MNGHVWCGYQMSSWDEKMDLLVCPQCAHCSYVSTAECYTQCSGGNISSFEQISTVFKSTSELDSHMSSSSYGDGKLAHFDIFAAISFNSIPGNGAPGTPGTWDYSIRVNRSVLRGLPYKPNVTTGWKQGAPGGLDTSDTEDYINSGFLTLQMLVDKYIIHQRNKDFDIERAFNTSFPAGRLSAVWNNQGATKISTDRNYMAEPTMYAPQFVQLSPLPIMGYHVSFFYQLVSVALALLFVLMYMNTKYTVVATFIIEKETRMRELLKIQGVQTAEFIGSWYLSYAVQFAVYNAIFTAATVYRGSEAGDGGIFESSSFVFVFFFFFLYSMSFVAKSFMLATIFGKARTGGLICCVIFLSGWFLEVNFNEADVAYSKKFAIASFFPVATLSYGIDLLAVLEGSGAGAVWSTVTLNPDGLNGFSFLEILALFILQIHIYTFLGWYLEQALPSQYGVRQPPWFIFLPSYWRPMRSLQAKNNAPDTGLNMLHGFSTGAEQDGVIEGISAEMEQQQTVGACIEVKGLRKVFSTPDGQLVAVANLHLSMFEGQIFALLGHNGAGKTTTISMLTGMTYPTSGDALVFGKSIVRDMPGVRQVIGFCPQHDVLYPDLTVTQHLRLFGRIKGIGADRIADVATASIAEVGLTEKTDAKSSSLSGGQKRKLSLAMSMIGDSKAIFLDEPTSGMDPYSRRSTWSMLQAARAGKVMVLTTHFMDEADILGDRIGIMAKGELHCCGSSLFLKSRYGGGYNLAFAKCSTGPAEGLQSLVLGKVEGSRVLSNIGAELKFQLPLDRVGVFEELFADLDSRKPELGFESYGVGITTMEEVFLRVAKEGERKVAAQELASDGQTQLASSGRFIRISAATTALRSCGSTLCGSIASMLHRSRFFENGDPCCCTMGRGFFKHLGAMFLKRLNYGIRDRKAQCCNTVIPILLLWFGLYLMFVVATGFGALPAMKLSLEMTGSDTPSPVPYNATYPGARPNTRDWDFALAIPKMLSPGPINQTVFGQRYERGLPFGDEASCTISEPRAILAMSKQLLAEGREHTMQNEVVYGGLLYPKKIAGACCHDTPLPCKEIFTGLTTFGGLDCGTQMRDLTTEGYNQGNGLVSGPEYMQSRCPDPKFCPNPEQREQIARSVTMFLQISKLAGYPELSEATLHNFCPQQCPQGSQQIYAPCSIATRLISMSINGMFEIPEVVSRLLPRSFSSPLISCSVTARELAKRVQDLQMQIGPYRSLPFFPQNFNEALRALNQTAQLLQQNPDTASATIGQFCPASCGSCDNSNASETKADAASSMVSIIYNTSFTHAAPVFLGLGDSSLKATSTGGSITIRSHPLPMTFSQQSNLATALSISRSLVVCLFVIVAYSFIPGALVEFCVREREHNRNAKHQQYVSGASIPAYWLASYIWDFCMYLPALGVTLVLINNFGTRADGETSGVGPLLDGDGARITQLLLVGYGLAIAPFTYLVGHLFDSHVSAQIYTILWNLITGVILMITSYILSVFDSTADVNEKLMYFYRVFPGFCLGHGLLELFQKNTPLIAMVESMLGMETDIWAATKLDIVYLYVSAFVYTVLLILYDYKKAYPAIDRKLDACIPFQQRGATAVDDDLVGLDEDVRQEADRVVNGGAEGDACMLQQLRKVYPGGKVAVRSLSLGIPKGECFGLLGINGAGKTSTLKVLTGDILPTAGSAYIGGMNVLEHQRAVRQLIGYCPQFDALLDLLTVGWHVTFCSCFALHG